MIWKLRRELLFFSIQKKNNNSSSMRQLFPNMLYEMKTVNGTPKHSFSLFWTSLQQNSSIRFDCSKDTNNISATHVFVQYAMVRFVIWKDLKKKSYWMRRKKIWYLTELKFDVSFVLVINYILFTFIWLNMPNQHGI